jgi:hypothetical protein
MNKTEYTNTLSKNKYNKQDTTNTTSASEITSRSRQQIKPKSSLVKIIKFGILLSLTVQPYKYNKEI